MDSSSSSASSGLSYQSASSREPTPEHDPIAAYEANAPPWWDEQEWDFAIESEDDESLTDGEVDLDFLINGELEQGSDDDRFDWGVDTSSNEEDNYSSSSDDLPPAKRFRYGSSDDGSDGDEDEDEARADGPDSSSDDSTGSSADDSEDGDGEGSDGGAGVHP